MKQPSPVENQNLWKTRRCSFSAASQSVAFHPQSLIGIAANSLVTRYLPSQQQIVSWEKSENNLFRERAHFFKNEKFFQKKKRKTRKEKYKNSFDRLFEMIDVGMKIKSVI